MGGDPVEQQNVSSVGYHDLDGRPGFKIAIQEVDDRWYLYLAHFWHRGWSILDVTDPTDPELVNFVEGPDNTTTKQIQVADGLMITALERPSKDDPPGGEPTDPAKPYKAGAYVWDLEDDPTDPQLRGFYDTGGRGTHRNYYAGGDYAYMCASPEGYEPTMDDPTTRPVKNFHLRIVDVSNPDEPEEVSTWMWPGQDPDDDREPENRHFHGPAYVQDDRAYLSYGRVGVVTLDLSDVESPEMIYNMGFGEGLGAYNGVHSFIPIPDSDLAVANGEGLLEGDPMDHENGDPFVYTYLLDISDERPPKFVHKYHQGPRVVSQVPMPTPSDHVEYDTYYEKPGRFGPHNQHHPRGEDTRYQTDDYLFMTYFNAGLRIFDISNPLAPVEAGHYVPSDPTERIGTRPSDGLGAQLEDVVVDSRGYIYCTDPNQGLFVLETDLL